MSDYRRKAVIAYNGYPDKSPLKRKKEIIQK